MIVCESFDLLWLCEQSICQSKTALILAHIPLTP